MKVESISIRDVKLFDDDTVPFTNQALDAISDHFVILGDTGSGKTTLLQAITCTWA